MWHKARQSFFWVDIEGKIIYECRWSDKKVTTKKLPRRVSLVLETEDINIVLLGVQGGLMYFDLERDESNWLVEIDKEIKDNRTNDGGYDPQGRVWVGTMLWVAHWGGFGVYRWDPVSGQMLDKIVVDVPNVSACAFGGPGNDVMLITTARQGMSQDDLLKYPGSGDVYMVEF